MAKAAKRKAGRPAKFKEPRITLTCRLQQRFYEQLKTGGAESGRSISEEIERRLERSFREDEVLSGPEVRDLAHTVTAIFAFVAKRTAISAGHSDWKPKEWFADQDCYQSATLEVCRTLIEGLPTPSKEAMGDTLSALERRLAIGLQHRGEIEGGSGFMKPKDDPQ